jgi:hypothetical protein
MTDHPTLERRLRDAADPGVWDDVSPDAWQQNERRVAADLRHRHVLRLQIVGVAAAAAAIAGLATVAVPRLDDHDSPATRTKNPPAGQHLKGAVEVGRIRQANNNLMVKLSLQPGKGGFVDLCQTIVSSGGVGAGDSSTGCGGGGPAGGPAQGTHVAYLTGSSGKDVDVVAGTVDTQVGKVRGWTRDGREIDANLIPLNRGAYRGFAFLSLKAADRPELIEMFGAGEQIREVVDVATRLDSATCSAVPAQPPATSVDVSGVRVDVDVASSEVSVWVPRADSSYAARCIPADVPFPALQVGNRVVALLPPDVSIFKATLESQQGKRLDGAKAVRLAGTAWQIAVFDPGDAPVTDAHVVLRDPLSVMATAPVATTSG